MLKLVQVAIPRLLKINHIVDELDVLNDVHSLRLHVNVSCIVEMNLLKPKKKKKNTD